ncbi:MAG: hypothetical protein IPM35_22325 [Myxococcales bacterium]|nr:hypothetical protein [Myxococcales bacterium]
MRARLVLPVLLTLAACGGNDSSDGSGGSSGGGSGGQSSGGSAGSGGGAGASGGSAGSGTGGSAGSGTGGSSTGGTGGSSTGGTGGSTATDNCQPLCDAIIAAKCSKGPTMSGCLLTCKALTSSAKCDPTANAYFACAKQSGIQCNAGGDAYAPGCGIDWLKAIDCATTENPNPAIVTPCATYCDKVVAAGCPLNAAKAECNSNCKWFGATGTGCDDEWGTFLGCANSANMVCVLGYAAAQGCGTQFTAYSKCIDAAGN